MSPWMFIVYLGVFVSITLSAHSIYNLSLAVRRLNERVIRLEQACQRSGVR